MSLISLEEVRDFVLNYISERAPHGDRDGRHIDDCTFDFLQSGIIDSLGVIELITAMEKHFQITVDFDQMDPEEFTVLGSFSRYVAQSAVANAGSDKA